jgi:hypothetical protein
MLKKQKKRNESGRNTVPAGTLQEQVMMSGDKPISDMRQSQMYPTPRARDHFPPMNPEHIIKNSQGWTSIRKKSGVRYGATLPDVVNKTEKREMYPTPTARDHKDTGENVNYEKIAKKHRLAGVVQMMPTPNACSGNNSGRLDEWGGKGNPFRGTQEGRGQLNPNWVTWLMGYPPNWVNLE